MEREETLAAWWDGVNETSREGLYLLVECLRCMEVGKTFELRWLDSPDKRFLNGRVFSEEAAEPEIRGTRAETQGGGTVEAAACRETGGWGSVTVVHLDGRVEAVVPKVSREQVDGWWRGLKLNAKDTLFMLVGWVAELKGNQVMRIRKLRGQWVIFRPRRRVPARVDGSDW